jgi:hypothetical protein
MGAFVEVSLWTFVWMGLFKIMVIVLASPATWGKLLIVVGLLQIMIQVPKWINAAKINPESHVLDHRLAFNLIKQGVSTLGGAVSSAAPKLGSWAQNNRLSSVASGRATPLNVNPSSPSAGNDPGFKAYSPPTTSPKGPSGGSSGGAAATPSAGASPVVPKGGAAGTSPPAKTGTGTATTEAPTMPGPDPAGTGGVVPPELKTPEGTEPKPEAGAGKRNGLLSPERRKELKGQLLRDKERKQIESELNELEGRSGGDERQQALEKRLGAHNAARDLLRRDDNWRKLDPPGRRLNYDEARAGLIQQGVTLNSEGDGEAEHMDEPDADHAQDSAPDPDLAPAAVPAPDSDEPPPRKMNTSAEAPPPFVPLSTDPAPAESPPPPPPPSPVGRHRVSRLKQVFERAQQAYRGEKGIKMAAGTRNQIRLNEDSSAAVNYVPGASARLRAQLFNAAALASEFNKTDEGFRQAGRNSTIGEQVRGRGEGWQGVAKGVGNRLNSGLRMSSRSGNSGVYNDTVQGRLDANDRKVEGTLWYVTNGESGKYNEVAQYLRDNIGPYDARTQDGDEANTQFRTGPAFFAADRIPAVDAMSAPAAHYRAQLAMGTYIATAMAHAEQPLGPDDFERAEDFARTIPSHTVQAALAISMKHNDDPIKDLDYVNTVASLGAMPQLGKLPNSRYASAIDAVEFNQGINGGTWQQAGESVRTLVQLGLANKLANPNIVAAAGKLERLGLPVTRDAVERGAGFVSVNPPIPTTPRVV